VTCAPETARSARVPGLFGRALLQRFSCRARFAAGEVFCGELQKNLKERASWGVRLNLEVCRSHRAAGAVPRLDLGPATAPERLENLGYLSRRGLGQSGFRECRREGDAGFCAVSVLPPPMARMPWTRRLNPTLEHFREDRNPSAGRTRPSPARCDRSERGGNGNNERFPPRRRSG
jgi:hypothetical protein